MNWITKQKVFIQGDSTVVVIPKIIRKILNLKNGDYVKLGLKDDKIILAKRKEEKVKKTSSP